MAVKISAKKRLNRSTALFIFLLAVLLFLSDEWPTWFQDDSPKQSSSSFQVPVLETPNQNNNPSTPHHALQRTPCQVLDVIDGDTIACDLNQNGRIERPHEKIRLLQVDTPETKKSSRNPSGEPRPFGLEAKAYTQNTTNRKTVYLEFDKKVRDRYGRTLAWVYLTPQGGKSVNESLLEEGLAKVMIYSPNYKHEAQMKAIEIVAKDLQKGLWQGDF